MDTGGGEKPRTDVWDYIAADNPHAAARMDELFSGAATTLAEHPKLGIPGTRELMPHESYRLMYEIGAETTVWILALVHTARQWPLVRKMEAFTAVLFSNEVGEKRSCYELLVIGLDQEPFTAESGVVLQPHTTLESAPPLDTVLIPGGAGCALWRLTHE